MKYFYIIALCFILTGCQTTQSYSNSYHGVASWYGESQKTASGKRFNPNGLTAAHKHYKFGTKLKLTNTSNNKTVVVTVNDRGPYVKGRELDVSSGAADVLGFKHKGVQKLKIEVLGE